MTFQSPSSKFLRILVADQECSRRSMIEKDLNGLGYYRVAPVSCFNDLITLTHYSPDPFERFDLVVINAELVSAVGMKALDFCLENTRLRHALIYDSALRRQFPRTFSERPSQQVRLIQKIDRTQLLDFLSLIDPSFDLLPAESR
ncbi:hypothetical protein [Pseudomonas protegens]|uniref:hypothetical protein n=1 Tax=Pseudomonas protegens TaxID=380021 RepID=UPI002280F2B5|nr:hypothetical protein [Pseudomonas protegens]MCY7261879.1 hypothetical protein [Pseudomonas protegens]